MSLPRSTWPENQNVAGRVYPVRSLSKFHHGSWIETGNVLKLKIRPGLSVRQLRFGERACDAILLSTAGFALRQSQ